MTFFNSGKDEMVRLVILAILYQQVPVSPLVKVAVLPSITWLFNHFPGLLIYILLIYRFDFDLKKIVHLAKPFDFDFTDSPLLLSTAFSFLHQLLLF